MLSGVVVSLKTKHLLWAAANLKNNSSSENQ
jgi:hypothetical protein